MTPLPYLAAVAVSGDHARDFLHAQLSADIRGLQPRQSLTACYCDPKGRVLDHLAVRAMADGRYTVLLGADRVAAFLGRIRMFVLRSEVHFEPLEHTVLGSVDTVPGTHGDDAPPVFEGPGDLRYALADAGQADGGDDTGPDALAAHRFAELERGMLWLNEGLSGRYLPQMLGLDTLGSVNFRKGCYPGQEVVARARYLGKVKRLPALAVIDGEHTLAVGEAVELRPDSEGETAAGEIAAVAAAAGRTAVFVVMRDRDAFVPMTLRAGEQGFAVQRWATM